MRLKLVWCAAAIAVFCAVVFHDDVSAAKAGPQKYALLIGIDDYSGGGFPPLQGAKNDAELIKTILLKRFEIPESNITLLLDSQATHTGIQGAFQTLTQTVRAGDFVYIHYSGHGSYTCDLNGDEESAWGKDSTWVSFGTRSASPDLQKTETCNAVRQALAGAVGTRSASVPPSELDHYDILDDQIHQWLAALAKKTGHIVFVSDSCHSGTVTRSSDALMTRGLPIDMRPHPLGTLPPETAPLSGIRITASRDHEKAAEYRTDDRIYGFFTWFWAKSLEESGPGDTWGDLYRRTRARIRDNLGAQTPQIQFDKDRPVFGGAFPTRGHTIAVTAVFENTAKIDAGGVLGVTSGSVYRKHGDLSESPSRIEITKVESASGEGTVTGSFAVGDLVTLERYAPPADPIRIHVRADLDKDRHLADQVKAAIQSQPVFEITDQQALSRFTLQIVRPAKSPSGEYIYQNPDDSLPQSSADAFPECWVMTPAEGAYQDIRVSLANSAAGIQTVMENLVKIAKVINLTTLTSAPGKPVPAELHISVWSPASKEAMTDDRIEKIEADGVIWQFVTRVRAEDLETIDLKVGQLLTFSVRNTSSEPYYSYLIDITSEGDIIPFFPSRDQGAEYGFIKPGEEKGIKTVTLLMDKPVREYIRLIASRQPVDIYVLEQQGYQTRSEIGFKNPLEELLSAKAGMQRGKPRGAYGVTEWGTVQGTFEVTQ